MISNKLIETKSHGFLWRKGKKTDLGLLSGDAFSDTTAINSHGQIVGISGNDTSLSAVLWENGRIIDLNTLVLPGSGLMVYWALFINDPGEIAAFAVDSDGNNHDVLLIPCDESHQGVEGCDYGMAETSPAGFVRPPLLETSRRRAQATLWRRTHRILFPGVGLKR